MATSEDQARLLVSIEATQNRFEKQLASIARQAGATAKGIEDRFTVANSNMGRSFERSGKQAVQSLGAQRAAVQNLSSQLQDIAVQLKGGASPLTIALQQGTQITQVLGQGGAAGAVRLLGSAFASLANPVSLATIAIIAGAGYAYEYFSTVLSGGAKSQASLEKEADLLDKVAQKWGDAIPSVKAYADARREALDQANTIEAGKILQKEAFTEILPYLDKFQAQIADLQTQMKDTNFQPIQQAFVNLAAKVKEGNATQKDLIDLQAAVRFAFINEGVRGADDFARSLSGIEPIFNRMADAAKKAGEEIRAALKRDDLPVFDPRDPRFNNGILPQTAPVPDRLTPDDVLTGTDHRTTGGFLRSRAVSDRIADRIELLDKDFADRLSQLLIKFPNLKIASAFRTFEEQKRIYDSGVRPAAKPGNSLHERGMAVDLSAGGGVPSNIQDIYAAAKALGIAFPVKNDPLHAQPFGARGSDSAASAAKATDSYQTALKRTQDQTATLKAGTDALAGGFDDFGYAVAKAQKIQELLNAAQRDGKVATADLAAATPALRTEIESTADAYARARAAGDQYKKSQRDLLDQQREINDFGRDIFGGIVDGLRAGKSAAEIFSGVLDKIADKLEDIALEALFPSSGVGGLFSGAAGRGGILGGMIIPGILHKGGTAGADGYGHGKAYPASTWSGARRYHSGGVAGLSPGEVPAILQRGEVVLPKGTRGGGSSDVVRVVLQDDSGRMANIADQQIKTHSGTIVQVAVQQSTKTVRKQMPGLMSEAQYRSL